VTYRLETAVIEDLPEMISWEAEIFGADAWSPELVVAEVSHPSNHYLIGRLGDEFAGYAGVRVEPYPGGHADIQTIAVLPEHRGRGLGRSLLQALLERAQQAGMADVFLEVRADNDAALTLYRDAGFEQVDVRQGYYQPDGVDAIVMRRLLESSSQVGPVGA
jgi:ribosomal-protein-alanine N-acetyltransferase